MDIQCLFICFQVIEAIFYLFSCVAESVDLEESVYLPALLKLLPQIPFNNVQLISTTLNMIGQLSFSCFQFLIGTFLKLFFQIMGTSI